ncbi:MAG: RDD family protein [Lysobacter sp.]
MAARPAGFWQRGAAWSLDAVLIAPVAGWLAWPWISAPAQAWLDQVRALLQYSGRLMGAAILDGAPLPRLAITLLHDPTLQQTVTTIRSATWALAWPALLAFALLGALYHVACECSPWQASVGKRLLGLRAGDRNGRRLGPGRALARYGAGTLSWATLNLGHLMATMAPEHLALHDRCSGTRVRTNHPELPRWALVWLVLLAIVSLVASAWLAQVASAVMQAALERALFWPG